MKNLKRALSILLTAALIASIFTACKKKESEDDDRGINGTGAENAETQDPNQTQGEIDNDYPPPDMVPGLGDNGYLEGINARDYVDDFDYEGLEIPYSVWHVDEDEAFGEDNEDYMGERRYFFPKEDKRIKGRKIENGDFVNIDYVGTVDGEEFSGGNSHLDGENGSNVIAGGSQFIDDFLTQIIGHSPGDNFEVNVTFPETYNTENLAGKEAVFVVDINYIIDKQDFIDYLSDIQVRMFIQDYLSGVSENVPDDYIKLLENHIVRFYAQESRNNGLSLADYLMMYYQMSSIEEMVENDREYFMRHAHTQLAIQAIAEDLKLEAKEEDVKAYVEEKGTTMEDALAEVSMAYLNQSWLQETVINLIIEKAKYLEEDEGDDEDEEENNDDNDNDDADEDE